MPAIQGSSSSTKSRSYFCLYTQNMKRRRIVSNARCTTSSALWFTRIHKIAGNVFTSESYTSKFTHRPKIASQVNVPSRVRNVTQRTVCTSTVTHFYAVVARRTLHFIRHRFLCVQLFAAKFDRCLRATCSAADESRRNLKHLVWVRT